MEPGDILERQRDSSLGIMESHPLRQIEHVLGTLLLNSPLQTPFDSVENAHQYVRLLVEAIAEAKTEIAADLGEAAQAKSERRVQALQIVQFKLDKLEQHLKTSSRLLNDLRTLRRLLLDERPEPTTASPDEIVRNSEE